MSTSELIRHRLPTKLQISINKTLFPSPFIFRFTFSILFFFFLLRFSIFEITFYFCLATDSPIFQKLDLIDMLFGCSGIRDQVFHLQMPNIEFLLLPCLLLREIVDLYDFNVSKFKYSIFIG
ncbi:hypothetical protein AAZX31_13G289700 [Glycine max]|nr:hypothetical protein GLYMA_13G307400v4 [Glycine max]KAH1104196.1 hypothetical protein GYH30_037887 [Glycine max]